MNELFRQGDVLIRPVGALPKGLKREQKAGGRVVLAHGEVTGHAHAIYGGGVKLFRDTGSNATFLLADRPVEVRHEEHGAIALEPGAYEVVRQREYPRAAPVRQVAD